MVANPFDLGLLAVTAAQNPQVAPEALALMQGDVQMPFHTGQQPFGGAGIGQFLAPNPLLPQEAGIGFALPELGTGLSGFAGGGTRLAEAAGTQVAGEQAGGQATQSPLAGLQGFRGPEPVKPIFQAGIRGAQGAPPLQGVQGALPIQQLLQAILGQGGQGVPALGALLGRVR